MRLQEAEALVNYVVEIEVDTRLARVWIHLMRGARFVVGMELASRWAIRGIYRLSRWRVKSRLFSGSWQRFEAP